MRRVFANANYDFIGQRRPALLFTGALLALSLAAMIFWQVTGRSWLNYGVDFAGGTVTQVEIGTPTDVAELRGLLGAIPGTEPTRLGEGQEFLIRTPGGAATDATSGSEAVVAALRQHFGEENVTVQLTEAVSAKVGHELQGRALLAILISFITTLIYLAIRFEWRFGLAAIIATCNDILLALGFISMLRLSVSLTTVAAVLTILGYSLNDTIVVFDRIRENLQTAKRQDFAATINRSVNETLPRTVLTSGTTLVTLLSLYLLGGGIIRDFALIMIFGVIIGTYSSIFIAAPALLEIEKRYPHETKKARAPTRGPARV